MKPGQVIATLGAVGSAVIAFWFASSGPIQPPDEESVVFLRVFCTVAAVLIGAGLLVLRHYKLAKRTYVLIIALAAGVLGTFAFFSYEALHSERIADVHEVDGHVRRVVVSDHLTEIGMRAVLETGTCFQSEVIDEARGQVSWECGRRAADELWGAYDRLFDASALTSSINLLTRWYWVTALSMMLALLLVVDEVLHSRGLLKVLNRRQ